MTAIHRVKKIPLFGVLVVLLLIIFISVPTATGRSVIQEPDPPSAWLIVQNVGQFDAKARYLFETPGGRIWVDEGSIWIQQLVDTTNDEIQSIHSGGRFDLLADGQGLNLHLSFSGGAKIPEILPFEPQPVHMSYFVGQSEWWRADVPVWGGLRLKSLYPGLDLILGGEAVPIENGLPWQLEAEPGADLTALQIRVEGAQSATLDQGGVHLHTAVSSIFLPNLLPAETRMGGFDDSESDGHPIELLPDDQGIIEIGTQYLLRPLVEQTSPAAADTDLDYSTFLGGGMQESAYDIAVDSTGAAYVTGQTPSYDFPTTPGPFTLPNGTVDAFVSKLNPGGSQLLYSCYMGGSAEDKSFAIEVTGELAEIAGETLSSDFPVTAGAYDTSCGTDTDGTCNAGGQGPYTDAFLVRVNETCTALSYSTYLGGSKADGASGLALENGSSYLSGATESSDFPGIGYTSQMDAFAAKFNSSGGLIYSRLVGGQDVDASYAIDVLFGNAFIAGETSSPDFPASGYVGNRDGFVVKLDAGGTPIPSYSKIVGGFLDDWANSIRVGANGETYIAGWTKSTNLPVTEGSFHGGAFDGYLFKLDDSASITYGTYLGGSGWDEARDVALDNLGGIYVVGRTDSTDFPVTSGVFQSQFQGGAADAFLTRYDLSGPYPSHISYSSFLGGEAEDWGYSVDVDPVDHIFLTGFTKSANFPITAGAYDTSVSDQDAFVTRMIAGALPSIQLQKSTNGQDAESAPGPYLLVGSQVTWTYLVSNSGGTNLSGVSVIDDRGVLVSCPKTSLQIGESMTCTASAAAAAGQYSNNATSFGTSPTGIIVSDSDLSHYFGSNPVVSLIKKTNGQDANSAPGVYILAGEPITWTYVLGNTGNVLLSDLVVKDDNGTPTTSADDWIVCTIPSLESGTSQTCSSNSTAGEGPYANLATVTAEPPGVFAEVSDSDPSNYFGVSAGIKLEKRTNGTLAHQQPGPFILVGDIVQWSFVVTNTGNANLTNVTIKDDNGTASNPSDDVTVCNLPNLAAGLVQTCTRSGSAASGQYHNTAFVSAIPPAGPTLASSDDSYYFGAQPAINLVKKINLDDANTPPGPSILAGQPLEWTYVVVNVGNVTLTNILVRDDNGTPVNPADDFNVCTIAQLSPSSQYTCSNPGTATPGQYTNNASASGTPPVGASVSDSDPSSYFGTSPGLTLEKYTNGLSADSPPGPNILAGTVLTWTYGITNSGNVSLSNVQIRDNNGTPANSADDFNVCMIPSLGVGSLQTCSRSGTAFAGQYTNIGTARGTPPAGFPDISTTDPSSYYGVNPSAQLLVKINGQDANTPPGPVILVGEPVTWTYTVVNNGNIALSSIVVKDNNGTPADPSDDPAICSIPDLGPAASTTCSFSGTAMAGQYANLGSLTAIPPMGPLVISSDLSHYYGAPPGIGLLKFTNGQQAGDPPGPYVMIGDPITWTYQLINTGEVDLFDVSLVDDAGTPADAQDDRLVCTFEMLSTGSTVPCSMTGNAVLGQYANTAVITGTPQGGSTITASATSHYFAMQPSIDLEKLTNGSDADSATGPYILAGDPITWTYLFTNTGNIALENVDIQDDNGTPAYTGDDFQVCSISILAAGQSYSCIRLGTAAPGQYKNTASVLAVSPGGLATVGDQDASHYFGASPIVDLVKKINDQDANTPPGVYILSGETITWTYQVTNAGNLPLTELEIKDDSGTPSDQSDDVIICTISSIGTSSSQTCTFMGTAAAGQHANTGTVTASPPGGLHIISDTDPSHYFGAITALDFRMAVNDQAADFLPGPYIHTSEMITWTYGITNTGNVPLSSIQVRDDNGTPLDLSDDRAICSLSLLGPGAWEECTLSWFAVPGQHTILGKAEASPPGGLAVIQTSDPSHYFGAEPGIDLAKRTNGQNAGDPPGPRILVGDPVSWTYQITNTGNVTLSNIIVQDDQQVSIACPTEKLVSDQSMTCTASGTSERGQYTNIGSVDAFPPGGLAQVSASDTSHYLGYTIEPAVDLKKSTNGKAADIPPGPYLSPGSPVTWEYRVANIGNVDLSDLVVVDDRGTPSITDDDTEVCSIPSLAVGASHACVLTGTAQLGQYKNVGAVITDNPSAYQVSDSDPSHYFGIHPQISLVGRVNGYDANTVPGEYLFIGAPITWTYEITNTGNITLADIRITDDNGTPGSPSDDIIVCTLAGLSTQTSAVCERSASAATGQHVNLANVKGTPPGGLAEVSATDTIAYFGANPSLQLIKRTNGLDADTPSGPEILSGARVDWSYLVYNDGNVSLSDLVIMDDAGSPDHQQDDFQVCTISNLKPGYSQTCSFSGIAIIGQYVNVGNVSASPPGELQKIGASDISHYLGIAHTVFFPISMHPYSAFLPVVLSPPPEEPPEEPRPTKTPRDREP